MEGGAFMEFMFFFIHIVTHISLNPLCVPFQ